MVVRKSSYTHPLPSTPFLKLANAHQTLSERIWRSEYVTLNIKHFLLQTGLMNTYLSDPPTCLTRFQLEWRIPATKSARAKKCTIYIHVKTDPAATVGGVLNQAFNEKNNVNFDHEERDPNCFLVLRREVFYKMTLASIFEAILKNKFYEVELRLEEAKVTIFLCGTDNFRRCPVVPTAAEWAEVQ